MQYQIRQLEEEREELTVMLANQKNITFVMELFCCLATEQVVTSLRRGKEKCRNSTVGIWNRWQYKDTTKRGGSHRILSVGGAERVSDKKNGLSSSTKKAGDNGRRNNNFLPSWIDRLLLQRFTSFERKRTTRQPSTPGNKQPFSPTINNNDNSSPSMPILIRKNSRRSNTIDPLPMMLRRRRRNVDLELVPDFMRED